MKIFFDTNVYVAESLLGEAAVRMVDATRRARWRISASRYLLDELAHVLVDELGFSRHLTILSQRRIIRRSPLVEGRSSAQVPDDPKDSPILQAALACGADYLVTNDRHLLRLDPYEGLRIISMSDFDTLLRQEGLIT
jgi:putative PIN family toxin of toxin-antitoxin system